MNNLKTYEQYSKVNEEFSIFGMDVVITLGELVEGAIAIIVIAAFLTFFGYYSFKIWIQDLIKSRSKIKALKELGVLINKYRDETIDNYVRKIASEIRRIKRDEVKFGMLRTDYEELSSYLNRKMTRDDVTKYHELLIKLGLLKNNSITWRSE